MNVSDDKIIELIEYYSNYYKSSVEYDYGKKCVFIRNNLKNRRFVFLFKKIIKKMFKKKNINESDKEIFKEFKSLEIDSGNNSRIVIYTCITGNYDDVEEPLIKEKNCDYFLFTNNSNIKSKGWEIKTIPENIQNLKDNVLINRYIKMNPFELFGQKYDYAIYIDGNIKIIGCLSKLIKCINNKTGIAIYRHISNEDIYAEIKNCIAYKKGDKKKLKRFFKELKIKKFPKKSGVFQCNVLVTDLKNEMMKNIFREWWKMFSDVESCKRDQIYLPYILWNMGIEEKDIGFLGDDISKCNQIIVVNHK